MTEINEYRINTTHPTWLRQPTCSPLQRSTKSLGHWLTQRINTGNNPPSTLLRFATNVGQTLTYNTRG